MPESQANLKPVKVWDYLEEYRQEKEEVLRAIERVLESGWLILGDCVKEFEKNFAEYCGCHFGIGVNSGTDALFLGLKALGIGVGDEVITVSNTAVPTVSATESTGATTRFVDIREDTGLMDVDQLENVIGAKTKCILVVHLFGQCVDMDSVLALASKHGLTVFEDCAQAHGARYKDRVAGSMGDIATFSFYPTKILGGYGDGGMITTRSEKIAAKCRRLRFYGMEKQYNALEHGYNSRLDELHASILLEKLKHLEGYIKRRNEIAQIYKRALSESALTLPTTSQGNDHVFYLYVVKHPKRDEILKLLREREIFLNVSYPWPVHIMEGYSHLGYKEGDLPVTEKAAREIFSLPMYPSLSDRKIQWVCDELKCILETI